MYGTHNVSKLSEAFALATKCAGSDRFKAATRNEFKRIARLIWESCGTNADPLTAESKRILQVDETRVTS